MRDGAACRNAFGYTLNRDTGTATLEGYLKAVDSKTGKELYRFKTASGIIGNVMSYGYKVLAKRASKHGQRS